MLRNRLRGLSQFFFPPRCPYCQSVMARGRSCCPLCAEALGDQHGVRFLTGHLLCAYSFAYKGRPREAVLRFKFKGRTSYAYPFAVKSLETVRQAFPDTRFDAVTAVPLSKARLRERGYNQSELLARELAAFLHTPYEELLDKKTENRVQHSLGKEERARNVQGVYTARGDVKGRAILLCDDIVTSGATLRECARILKESGAKSVSCLVIAHAN